MRHTKGLAGYVAGALLTMALLTGGATAQEYTVGLVSYYGHSVMIVAAEKGFFAEEGVTVTPKKYWDVTDWFEAITHDRFDFGITWNSAHIELVSSGSQKVLLGGFVYSQNTAMVITKPEVTPENLIQHRVGMTVDLFSNRWILWNYLQQHQLKMSDVQIVANMSDQDLLDNFLGGRLQVVLLVGDAAQTAIHQGSGVVIATETPAISFVGLAMAKTAYDTIPHEDLKGIMRGVIKAMEWMRNPANERELYELLKAQWTEGGAQIGVYSSFEAFQEDRRNFVDLAPEDLYEMNSVKLREFYAEAERVLAAMGKATDFLVFDELVDTSILLEVLEEMGYGPKSDREE